MVYRSRDYCVMRMDYADLSSWRFDCASYSERIVLMSVAVIVPTRNSERTLESCLRSIRAQSVPTQIVVVDNCSTDRTAEIARRFADITLIQGPERSAQRNAGWRAADAE